MSEETTNTGTAPEQNETASETTAETAAPEPPAGTTTPGVLFDLTSPEEKKKQAAEEKAQRAREQTERNRKKVAPAAQPKKYEAGAEVRYQGHTLTLEKAMTAKEVLDWISEDDFPELAYEEVELRHDKEKNRLVPVRKAQKKGV